MWLALNCITVKPVLKDHHIAIKMWGFSKQVVFGDRFNKRPRGLNWRSAWSLFFFLLIYWFPKSTKYYTYIFKIHHTDRTITNYKQNANTKPAFKILKQNHYKFQLNTLPETL